jgi:hypothetical protein
VLFAPTLQNGLTGFLIRRHLKGQVLRGQLGKSDIEFRLVGLVLGSNATSTIGGGARSTMLSFDSAAFLREHGAFWPSLVARAF